MQRLRRENENSIAAMTAAKNEVFFGLQHKNCYLVGGLTFGGGNKNLVGGLLGGDFFQMGEDDQIFETYCSEAYSKEPT